MSKQHVSAAIESLLFVVGDEGLSIKQLQELLDVSKDEVSIELNKLMKEYEDEKRGLQLVEIAGQFQFATKQEYASYVEKLIEAPPAQSLSQAALETLAIVAYRQPITRAEIEEIRGVKTERPLQTLIGKALLKEAGRAEGAGRAILYGTTKEFLAYFGLKDLSELPPLPEDEAGAEQEADLFFRTFQETE
ncbi:SMC-Scp complex subunit ScpB [Priestia flexa]|jgi:segregation and condensation protein B|uniref:Segregation and condensation protein B n=2 Tax=Priestia TaxID=2800373 RepID=A0A0V8JR46_9BACI|nr:MULTISPECIES: SMC-Scp complex subunit ScpB [Bacillaceae]AQX53870.1 SMC-Scp complex subunit ScpB [Priestia flexa]KSU89547.1 segregation and condensation protein B [Priestia veravalensis]KZB92602.1 segregation and condensation protein B [Bacillus sp. VT 712]MBN8250272.1 SMC-Scp complex subunit ScpB [Priestia flexa]MBN8432906.1 SMC-Scp complex subunit ScpB [Priestia flexa]